MDPGRELMWSGCCWMCWSSLSDSGTRRKRGECETLHRKDFPRLCVLARRRQTCVLHFTRCSQKSRQRRNLQMNSNPLLFPVDLLLCKSSLQQLLWMCSTQWEKYTIAQNLSRCLPWCGELKLNCFGQIFLILSRKPLVPWSRAVSPVFSEVLLLFCTCVFLHFHAVWILCVLLFCSVYVPLPL